MDYAVLKSEEILQTSDVQESFVASATYREYEPASWFPLNVVAEHYFDGKLDYRHRVDVNSIQFNHTIDAKEFEIASLELPVGRQVALLGGRKVWDGEQLIADPAFAEKPMRSSVPLGRNRNSWRVPTLVANAVVCAVLFAVVLRKKLQASNT